MNQREIILVPFPFSDLNGKKVRPALILSKNKFNTENEDVLICAITSNITPSPYTFLIDQTHLEKGNLHEKSAVKVENIAKIHKSLIIKRFAQINEKTFSEILKKLRNVFE